jgi:hypothetical protein
VVTDLLEEHITPSSTLKMEATCTSVGNHLQNYMLLPSYTFKMEAACFSEKSIITYKTIRYLNSECHRRENFKFHIKVAYACCLTQAVLRTKPMPSFLLQDLIILTVLAEEYKSYSSSICNFLHSSITWFVLS